MATKAKTALGGGHTAGIYADMTVDGPQIGTLVAIVDRAKNLPNRKTIGKQDPYCAARLGKEAKKTTTDIRGGQTPKWDQELRFTVHDSPDYYQLKVSVFTDDKRTDLIGEAWVDLRDIIVPGGGQNDMWQTLTCKGKYAGEIRVEITYYDTRPKPEKVPVKAKQPPPQEAEGNSTKGRAPMKRRPLPSDPVTGEAPPAPSPTANPEFQTPPRHARQSSHAGFVPTQSPLQSVEYGTPPSSRNPHPDHYSPSIPEGAQQVYPNALRQSHRSREQFETPPRHADEREWDYDPRGSAPGYDQAPRGLPAPDAFHRDDMRQPSIEDDRPPPPPAHRSRQSASTSQDFSRSSLEMVPAKATPPASMRHDVLRSEAHRQSSPGYPGRPTFREFDSAPAVPVQQSPRPYDQSAPRHHSYDMSYDAPRRAMQPTVEDAPDSPTGFYTPGQGQRRNSRYEDHGYEPDPSPQYGASRSPGASPYQNQPSPGYDRGLEDDRRMPPNDARHYRAYSEGPDPMAAHRGHQPPPQQYQQTRDRRQSFHEPPSNQMVPALPPSLVPGVDPALSREISDRIYEERRHGEYQTPQQAPPRGRHTSEPPPTYGGAPSTSPGHGYQFDPRASQGHRGRPEPAVSPQRDVFQDNAPAPPHSIQRKSVSPGLPPENRRLSDVPFGPDSYDSLNPSMVSSRSDNSEYKDPDAKIITHDGREIDPSDHLPMDSWAPEPEARPANQASPAARSRPSPSGAQPMPPSGRRPLRVAARPSAAATPPRYDRPDATPPATASTGRNRLQKKSHSSAVASPSTSSPLAPISPDNFQYRPSPQGTPTRGARRSHPWDYPSENHAPHHGSAPPIPAKVPLPVMSGANGVSDEQLAMMEEMQRIDIGTGRSRRRGGY